MEEADPALALSLDSVEMTPGESVTLSVDVSNAGPDAVAAVAIEIVFPPDATGIEADSPAWTCALVASTLSCTLTQLGAWRRRR